MRKTRTRKAPIVLRREAARAARKHVAAMVRDAARHILPTPRYLVRRQAEQRIAALAASLLALDELEQAALAAVRDHFRAARRRILDARASR